MQAIILAAGMGRRLGEMTKENTKCMLSINGKRLIDRTLEQLANNGIQKVIIVVGYSAKNLIEHIGNRYEKFFDIEFINNPIFDKTNNIYSLALAKEKMIEDDTILLESDLIYEESVLQMAIESPYPNLALVSKWESWMDGTVVQIDDQYNIINFINKKAFSYRDAETYYKTVNIYKFSKEFAKQKYIPFLNAYCEAQGNNEYYEQVLRVIAFLNSQDVKALPIGNKKWYEIDDIQDKDIAETIFANNDDEQLAKMNKRYGGYWRFPQLLDYCYLVNPYFPPKRMLEEMRANFDTLLTEYPSGMGVNSLLAGKYFGIKQEYTVVGNGAAELIKSLLEKNTGKIGIVLPTFEEYSNRYSKADIVAFVPDNKDCAYNSSDLIKFYDNKPIKTLLLINPDNPSGNFIPKKEVLELAEWTKNKGIKFIVDESFVDFSDDFRNNSLLDNATLSTYKHLFVMKSISKSYGVPGLRLGILASSDTQTIDYIKKDVSIWNINSFAEFYMQIFNKYSSAYDAACECFIAERTRFAKRLEEINWLRVIPSQANYFLCEVKTPHTSAEITKRLLKEHSILIKDCNSKQSLENKNFIRIAIRNEIDNEQLIKAFKQL
ncbi:MAG: aminotransferase class I/II-fold pyridoxal phosphate-dependent enzyme [Prevotella pallens]|jgi:aminotransferase, class I/II|uniref:aminotransferase class I/II-fold pyridoxal phosphate-dependent enzyme n=1 Tax=Prevotella pallens TaxID=60133 RepID=UPI001CADB577|nr:aminotransferase class I/II-fold pyridoxal phosphate-dependent enzyme [Prevotella pallens]MBF1525480.1 aminotransferase class I/II-fold pyridoxal phosphate-dependent enzyme [Prevotella pallens]